MALIFKTDESVEFKRVPKGTHFARLVQIIGLGVQESPYQKEGSYRILLTFEVPEEVNEDGKPLLISKEVKFSHHPKSGLYKVMKALLGDDDLAEKTLKSGCDLKSVLGKTASLSVGTVESSGNHKIDGVFPLPKGVTLADAYNEMYAIDPDDVTDAELAKLPNWIQNKINNRKDAAVVVGQNNTQHKAVDF